MAAQDLGQMSPVLALSRMMGGARLTQLIYVAAKLGIADVLTDGPKSIDDLAQGVRVICPPLSCQANNPTIEARLQRDT